MTTLTTIIAAYNAAGTITQALDSVLAQTRPADEIIVCDDGSTDATPEILAGYGDKITVIRQANGGVSAARSTAGHSVTSDWVVFLDADDEWMPTRLERIAEAIDANPQADIISTNAVVRTPGHADHLWYSKTPWPEREDDQPAAIMLGTFIFSSAAVRRAAMDRIGWFRTDLPHQGEWEGWVRLVLSGSRAARILEPLAIYNQGVPGQLSGNKIGTWHTMLAVIEGERGKHGPIVDAAIDESRSRILPPLRRAEGVQAVRSRNRKGCLRAAASPALSPIMRAKFALASIAPSVAGRFL